MASTYSPYLRLELIGTGEQTGTWGNTTNTNLGTLVDQAVAGTATIDVTAGNVTLTALNGASDQSRQAILKITGTPVAARNVIAPESSKWYLISNECGQTVTLKGASTTGYAIADGETLLMFWTGTDFAPGSSTALGYTPVNKAGDTMTGNLILNAAPSTTLGAATKGYVDDAVSGAVGGNFVLKSGDTMTGALTLSGAPTTSLQAATKGYVDSAISGAGYATQTWVTSQNYVTTTTSSLTNYYTKTDADNRYVSTSTQNLQYYPLTTYLTNNYSTTTAINTTLGYYCAKSDNLSGLGNYATARTNLGLGTMATQTATDYALLNGSSTITVTKSSSTAAAFTTSGGGLTSYLGPQGLSIGAASTYISGDSTQVAIGTSTKSWTFSNATGNGVAVNGSWINGSDRRIKENIVPVTDGLSTVAAFNPVKFSYKGDNAPVADRFGLIAQELEQVVPDVVYTEPNEKLGLEDFKAVAYTELVPILIKAIQELKAEVDALKAAK